MIRCLNCGLCLMRLRRYHITTLSQDLQTILAVWLRSEHFSLEDVICNSCYEIIQFHDIYMPRWLGHTSVCVGCGVSVKSIRNKNLDKNSPFVEYFPWIKSDQNQRDSYKVCYNCYVKMLRRAGLRVKRKTANSDNQQARPEAEVTCLEMDVCLPRTRPANKSRHYIYDGCDMSVVSSDDRVFIDVSAEKNGEGKGDCVMVLESVQVDVDPSSLMLVDRDQECDLMDDSSSVTSVRQDDKPAGGPISLLTSSDDDDVILQEPHIDTVEVSDETDEDDVPLVKLADHSAKSNDLSCDISDIVMYVCLECPFRTKNKSSMLIHRENHTKVLLMCPLCGYMTSSESQLFKHEKQHKDMKQFACDHCDYRAKHKMSLQYHMKSHNVKRLKCSKCDFRSEFESEVLSHSVLCGNYSESEDLINRTGNSKKFVCPQCPFSTDKRRNLRRHKRRLHTTSEDDADYEPGAVNHSLLSKKSGKKKKSVSKNSGEKKHSCPQCEYSTNKPSDLRRHSRTHQTGAQETDCEP